MRLLVFILIAVLIPIQVFTQNITGVIKYRFMYTKNPINIPEGAKVVGNNKIQSDENIPAYLYFNAQKSLFDYDKTEYNKELTYQRKTDNYGQMYFIDKSKGELYFREFVYRNPYITHEPIPVIPWQLKNEVKTILGYVCKKAEATFRGRKYIVWYTPAIPVSVGPWKLQGLPGVILEAETEDMQVKFVVESIRIPADVEKELSISIETIPDGKIVTFEEYLQAFEKERKAQEVFLYNLLKSSLGEVMKKENIKGDINTLKVLSHKMFTIEKYE